MRRCCIAFLILVCSCRSTIGDGSRIDHVVIGVANLEAGMAAFERATGVAPQPGGAHVGRGTRNALVSLGNGSYLEIVAPQVRPDAVTDRVKGLQALTAPKIIGWVERVRAASIARAALEGEGFTLTPPLAGSRVTPAGLLLEWTRFSIVSPQIVVPPSFIEWGKNTVHPSQTSARGCAIRAFEVVNPKADVLNHALKTAGISLRAVFGDRARIRLALQCGTHSAEFVSE